MTARFSKAAAVVRARQRDIALTRPEMRHANDGFARAAPASPMSAPVKVTDPQMRRLIDEAVAKMRGQQ